MATIVNGLIIFLFALIPGVPGEVVYSEITGLDWTEDRLRRLIRIIVISVTGLMVYIFVDDLITRCGLGLADPKYVMPAYVTELESRALLSEMAWAYFGHVVASLTIGSAAGLVWARQLAGRLGSTPYPSAWDDLVNDHAAEHWITISLVGGASYAGMIETADTGVAPEYRDVLLAEPAQYDAQRDAYISLPYQHLFIPSSLIDSVAVVHDEQKSDERVSEVGEPVFKSSNQDDG
jgi:hypothetical protein